MTTKELIDQYVTAHADNRWMDASELEALLMEFAEKLQEPASEDLEQAAVKYEHNRVYEDELEKYSNYLENLEEGEIPKMKEPSLDTKYLLNADIIDAFKNGAQWQREQMMKDAIECEVYQTEVEGIELDSVEICSDGLMLDNKKYKAGDKVKVIIIKE